MPASDSPYLTLVDGSDEIEADCGCALVRNHDDSVDLFLCALHLEAIE